jgi:cytochrome c556
MKKLLLLFILISLPAFSSELIDKRKENYQANKDHMRLIYNAIKSNDLDQVIKSANVIESFVATMPSFFPEGSESRGASDNIWLDFSGFEKSSKANEIAARALKVAAQENNIEELNNLFDVLSNTCKSCHRSYKN